MAKAGLLGRIGPAFIVGACIIGPGSVTLMSTTGANYGYALLWLSLVSGGLMAGFLALFMRFGILAEETFLGLAARKFGRWFAVLCGITLFSVDATFQFGNALGVTAGMQALWGGVSPYVWPVAFTAAAIIFLFAFKHIYRHVEKMMRFFLVLMFLAFLVNLVWAGPNLLAALKGAFVPSLPEDVDWVTVGGLVGTTFVIVAAFFQSYLVKAKGWHEGDLRSGITDTVLASIIFTLIGTVIMMTAAAALYPHEGRVTFEVMIRQLESVFGPYARLIFCVGFWSAAFSSFITNSLIGGVLLSDGLGLGGRIEARATRIFATLVLLIGMTTGLFIIHSDEKAKAAAGPATATLVAKETPAAEAPEAPAAKTEDLKVRAIRVGQAATMLAVPLGAIAMVAVLFDKRATGGRDLPWWAKAFVLLGAAVLLGIAVLMYVKIQPELYKVLGIG
ncbi:MAG TPA: Nramp family divalent metal transporter [Phycisphaerae bacterium]|nr:Nramp family divalent metal transporter [Phycisphaerae bacterium]